MREAVEAIRVLGLWRWLWYRTLYRTVMRLMHRFNWHHAPVIGPMTPCDERYLNYQRWCRWCGFRESYRSHPESWRFK